MREDSCSGVGARRDRELEPSGPEGGAGSLWRKSSSTLLCSLRFSPWGGDKEGEAGLAPKDAGQAQYLVFTALRGSVFPRGDIRPR